MTHASKPRWLRFAFSLRTLFVVVTVVCIWLGWNVNQVQRRNAFLEYLDTLEHKSSPADAWVISCDPNKLPWLWRMLGARHDWAMWVVQSEKLNETELARAKSLLPDCSISVIGD